MTKDPGIFGIPLPNDCAANSAPNPGYCPVTQVGTVVEITAFYQKYLSDHGWIFEPAHSVMDPNVGAAEPMGYGTRQVWCRPTSPIDTVQISWGSGTTKDSGKHATGGLTNIRGESSCP